MELAVRAMGSLLPKLGELLKEEYSLQKGVKTKIETLSRELEAAHAVLREISNTPPDQLSEVVKLWARDVREASYDMEDIVDAFLVRVVGSPEPSTNPHMLRRMRRKVGALFKKSKARRNISVQIKEIYDKLEELTARRDRYRTPDSIVTKPATNIDPRIVNLYKSATELVGIEGPKDELINMLSIGDDGGDVSGHNKMKIVSIVGFGGLGKTTLAKAVYDQLKVHFKWKAFIPVGRNPDIKKVLRDILTGLDKDKFKDLNMMMFDEKQLMDELNEFVKEKRCFIVIDDIWDKESWKLIKCAIKETNCGSRLVITTRNSEVATYAGEAYRMQPLSHDNSKRLLYARIVDGEGKDFDSPSAEACEKVLKKCGGVPLAIITIASLLASKPREDWSEVYNSIGFGHKGNGDVDNTRKILSFSYYDLPSYLKPCLLYLSIVPEDYEIEKNTLIWMWMAEGLICEEQAAAAGVGIFDLGERYFNELINRSMIEPKEKWFKGYVNACSVHDMVLDFIRSLVSSENFVTILDGGERQQKLPVTSARRLALHGVEGHISGRIMTDAGVEKVRSLFVTKDGDFGALFPRLPFLRLVGAFYAFPHKMSTVLLDNLGRLRHLRYLSPKWAWFDELPREIRYLKFLQTLDLRTCNGPQKLPEDVGLLTQLVCLRSGSAEVPAGLIGKLASLQELDMYHRGDKMQFVKELGMLKELRVLGLWLSGSSEGFKRGLLESLGNLHNIKELRIEDYRHNKDVMDDAAAWVSCRRLRFLRLDGFVFSGLTAWINPSLAPNLSYLDVEVVAVREQDMEALARLRELRCLKLLSSGDTKLVSIKIPTDGVVYFGKLRVLVISGTSIWFDLHGIQCSSSSRVASSNTIMPSLESLDFEVHVRSLKDEELLIGFENIGTGSLQRVNAVVNCEGACTWEVEELEAALEHAATLHPKHPTLLSKRFRELDIISPYKEACMASRRAPELVTKAWKLADIVGSGNIQILRMPDPHPPASSSKVIRLFYTDDGVALFALCSNAVHKLWKWERSDKNPHGKSSKSPTAVIWQTGKYIDDDTTDGNPEEAAACNLIDGTQKYVISKSGGYFLMFDTGIFEETHPVCSVPPPTASFLAVYRLVNETIFAIGREDSSILIFNYTTYGFRFDDDGIVLKGHQKKITGLAFSKLMNVLVSSGADAQLCVWNVDGWEKKKSRCIEPPPNHSGALVGDTSVQIHYDQAHILVAHETQLVIYDWQLESMCSWFPRNALPAPVSSAVYSANGLLVYAGFRDGAIGMFEAESLTLQCRIAPSAYIPSSISSGGETVFPTVVTATPWKPNQIAVGMSDGAVHLLEPLDTDIQLESNASSEEHAAGRISSSRGDSQPIA